MASRRSAGSSVPLSADTHALLNEMIGDSRLNAAQQRRVKKELQESGLLPKTLVRPAKPARGGRRDRGRVDDANLSVADRNRREWLHKKGIRTKKTIDTETGSYQVEEPRITTMLKDRDKEKEKLQRAMAGISEDVPEIHPVGVPKQPKPSKVEIEPVDVTDSDIVDALRDEFAHLQTDIHERESFLLEMETLGRGDEYRKIVMAQINDKLAAMERVDKMLRDRSA